NCFSNRPSKIQSIFRSAWSSNISLNSLLFILERNSKSTRASSLLSFIVVSSLCFIVLSMFCRQWSNSFQLFRPFPYFQLQVCAVCLRFLVCQRLLLQVQRFQERNFDIRLLVQGR